MHPLISVIIPTYNRALTIMKSIESVLNQTFQDFEIVVVDDGSEDETGKVMMELHQHTNVKYHKMEHGGVSKARNYGADHAQGNYLVFLDSDDLVHEDWLKIFSELMSDGCDLAFCASKFIYPDGKTTIKYPKKLGYLYNNITGIFNAGAYCVTKVLFEKSKGFDSKISFGENYELGLRLAAHSLSHQFTTEPLLYYNKAQKRDLEGLNRRIDSKKYLLVKYKNHPALDRRRFMRFKFETQQSLAIDLIQLNKKAEGRQLLWKSAMLRPFQPKPYVRLLLSFFDFYKRKHDFPKA